MLLTMGKSRWQDGITMNGHVGQVTFRWTAVTSLAPSRGSTSPIVDVEEVLHTTRRVTVDVNTGVPI